MGQVAVEKSSEKFSFLKLLLFLSSPLQSLLGALKRIVGANFRLNLFLSGLSDDAFEFPAATPGRVVLLDYVLRLVKYCLRVAKILTYPEILFRNIFFAMCFQGVYEAGGFAWKRLRQTLYAMTKNGRRARKFRQMMDDATSYDEFRSAEKAYDKLREAVTREKQLTPDEQDVCDKLDRRFFRYRDLIRNEDSRQLQFELRAGLLRKHFGHEQFHPKVRKSIERYVGVVCCAFSFCATSKVPDPLRELIYGEDDEEIDVSENLGKTESRRVASSSSLVGLSKASDKPSSQQDDSSNGGFFLGEAEEEDEPVSPIPPYGSNAPSMDLREQLLQAQSKLDFFAETRHSFGRSALLLSGGARMGLYHVGVIKTLMDHDLLPRVVSGSSAGSIIAAMLGCKTDEEVRDELFCPERLNLRLFGRNDSIDTGLQSILRMEEPPDYVKDSLLAAFTGADQGKGNGLFGTLLMLLPSPFPSYIMILRKLLPRWMDSQVLLDIDILQTAIRNVIGDMTFGEAYIKTGRIINITATPRGADNDVPNLLNYLSAPNVTIASAACASSCIPGVFAPVALMSKTITGDLEPYSPAGLRWIDGSIESDLPMQRLAELFNINHFIVSQVNPHGWLLAPHEPRDLEELSPWDRGVLSTIGRAVSFCRDQSRSYVKHITGLGLFRSAILSPLGNGLVPLLVQKYSGDVTMYPRMKVEDLKTLLVNPSNEEYLESMLEGQKMAWPKIASIRRRCSVEFILDDCVHAIRKQIEVLEQTISRSRDIPGSRSFRSFNLSPPSGHMSRVSSFSMFQGKNPETQPIPTRQASDPDMLRGNIGGLSNIEEHKPHLPTSPFTQHVVNTATNASNATLGTKLMDRITSVQHINTLAQRSGSIDSETSFEYQQDELEDEDHNLD